MPNIKMKSLTINQHNKLSQTYANLHLGQSNVVVYKILKLFQY